jgi:hypothetical protein
MAELGLDVETEKEDFPEADSDSAISEGLYFRVWVARSL